MEHHVIVGAGQSAAWAAAAMRKAGFAGGITMIGGEPDHPYERPPLSKDVLLATSDPLVPYVFKSTRFADERIQLTLGRLVEAIEPRAQRVRLDDGSALPYDKLLLATGGRARRLAIPGAEHAVYLRTMADAVVLRRRLARAGRVVCIGAGVVGLEIASSARALGCTVNVLEAGSRVMGRAVAPDIAARILALHRDKGVAVRLGATVTSIGQHGGRYRVAVDGDVIEADVVVAGVGMERNDELARMGGIETDNGILVDPQGRTNVPNVYAAGDVAAFWHPQLRRRLRLEAWQHAQDHGLAVGTAMVDDAAPPYQPVPWFWSDQHGARIQVAGLPADATRLIVREEADGKVFTGLHLDAGNVLVGATNIDNPRVNRLAQRAIRAGRQLDPHAAADPAIPIPSLLK